MIYRVVHTGANSQLGGLKNGLLRPAYHVGMFFTVNAEPTPPASSDIPIAETRVIKVFRSVRNFVKIRLFVFSVSFTIQGKYTLYTLSSKYYFDRNVSQPENEKNKTFFF